jgi:hypothetical protein
MARAAANSDARKRSALPLVAAAVFGAVLAVALHPAVGLPIAGAGLAGLTFQKRGALFTLALALGTAATTALADATLYVVGVPLVGVPVTARAPFVFAVLTACSLLAVGPLAAALLRRRSALETIGVVAVALTALQFAALAALAAGAGRSLGAYASAATESLATQAGVGKDIVATLSGMWPGALLTTTTLTALFAVLGVSLVGAQQGQALKRMPVLPALDLDPKTVLLPIMAVALLAAGRFAGDGSWLTAVGENVLVVARWVFFLQGLAVFAGLYQRAKVPRFLRAFGFVLLGVTEAFVPLVSLTGLADIWLNIRRLPRAGELTQEPEAPSGVD